MNDAFDGGNRTGAQAFSFHDGCIHSPHSIQLSMSPVARIEEPATLEHSNGLLYCDKCGATTIQEVIADLQRGPQTGSL